MKSKPQLLYLPRIIDARGNLSYFENNNQIPFTIKRSYWIYDVPGGESREGHANIDSEEFIIALSGSFDIKLDDGFKNKLIFSMNRAYYGLYIPRMYWRLLENFSTNSLALIVSNSEYNNNDYIYDFNEFKKLINVV